MMRSDFGRAVSASAVVALLAGLWSWLDPSLALASEAGEKMHGFGNSKPVAFLFWMFAAGTLGGSLFVITRRNMVAAVMGMVATFFAIAGLYLMLYASFLAVIQVLVYAGAIMVLFVFVIMILNKEEDEPWALEGLLGKGLAGLSLLYLFVRVGQVLWSVRDQAVDLSKAPLPKLVDLASQSQQAQDALAGGLAYPDKWQRAYEFGSVKGVGYTLFTDYLFPFEAVSLVLLVAVVGAIAIAHPSAKEQKGPEAS